MNDLDKERIKFNTETIKLLTLLFITTGGGGLALVVQGLTSPARLILAVTGTFFAVGSGVIAMLIFKSTVKKLQR